MSDLRLGSVVIDCEDFDRMLAFWSAALGYVPREAPSPGWAVLRDPKRPNVNLSLQGGKPPRPGPRLHLDLYASDRSAEVQRLLGLGATLQPRTTDPREDFTVLADPDGNLFCVVQKNA
jgi:catechol 2,3-dioxygenase-like lactoylglutathione lyase family enzyme